MNIIELIYHDLFLKRLYPEGLSNIVGVGQFCLKDAGTFSMSIHTRKKPALEIPKCGIYGDSYDVVVLNLSGSGPKKLV
jgi:hypothetical protein